MSAPAIAARTSQLSVGDMRSERAALLATEPMVPASPDYGLVRGAGRSVADIWRYRSLLNLLFRRELKVRYKDSVLGFLWTLIRPVAQLLVYAVAIGKFLHASKNVLDYPIYVFAGLTLWALFSECLSSGTGSLLGNAGLIKKLYLPREVFPLAAVASALFNMSMQLVILVAGTFALGHPPIPSRLGYAALALLVVLIWGTGLALVLGAVNVYLRDTQYIVEIFLLWGLWTAPIVYQWSQVSSTLSQHASWLRELYLANPFAVSVLGMQRGFWAEEKPSDSVPDLMVRLAWEVLAGLVVLIVAQRIFSRLQANFAQEL